MKTATDKDKRFWDQLAEKYAKTPIADEEAYKFKLDMTRDYLSPQSRVLEFGCGTGGTAIYHAPHVAQIDAIDLSDEMIAIAKQKARAGSLENVSFAQGDIASLPVPEVPSDVGLGLSILHLLRDRTGALARVHELLAPGGVFISSTACLTDMGAWRFLLPVMQLIGKAPYVEVFSAEQLVAEQEQAGFEIIHQWQPKQNAALFLAARKI